MTLPITGQPTSYAVDAARFRLQIDIWTDSAAPWVCLDSAIPHFPQSPVPPES